MCEMKIVLWRGAILKRKVIIIEGYLSSGKSTFALQLSKKLNIPYLVKDTFKKALYKNNSITNREESSFFLRSHLMQ